MKSKGRQPRQDCTQSFAAILAKPHLCYDHDVKRFNYWEITQAQANFFRPRGAPCPFQGGLNQLWRNQLLGLSVEAAPRQLYQHVTFSVVRHPRNKFLDKSLTAYQDLIGNSPKFSTFTSAEVLAAASALHDPDLDHWMTWYKDLYAL